MECILPSHLLVFSNGDHQYLVVTCLLTHCSNDVSLMRIRHLIISWVKLFQSSSQPHAEPWGPLHNIPKGNYWILIIEFWINGELSKSAKNHPNLSIFFSLKNTVVPRSYATPSYAIFANTLFWIGSQKTRVKLFFIFFPKLCYFLSPQLHYFLLNENKQPVHMRDHLFLQYQWFLQNIGKDFIRTNMHTEVIPILKSLGLKIRNDTRKLYIIIQHNAEGGILDWLRYSMSGEFRILQSETFKYWDQHSNMAIQ